MTLSFGFAFLFGGFTFAAGWVLGVLTRSEVNDRKLYNEYARGKIDGLTERPYHEATILKTDFRRIK